MRPFLNRGQLPPIDKKEDNHLLDHPHIFLDEIMRQAMDSEIIKLSMDIRNGNPIEYSNGNEVIVAPKASLNTGMMQWADQILCATNNTRVALNNQMRDLLGRGDAPEDGDKVICLKNYWDCIAENEDPLVNGTIGYIKNSFSSFVLLPKFLGSDRLDVLQAEFVSDNGAEFGSLDMDKKMILTGQKCCDWKTEYRANKNHKTAGIIPKEFTYGYAITTWKAQGSEWDKVLIIEEKFPFDREEHQRFLYTAITRASQKVVLIRA